MNSDEVRMRCLEMASRAPIVHNDGPAAGVLETATLWSDWVISGKRAVGGKDTLHLPGKSKS